MSGIDDRGVKLLISQADIAVRIDELAEAIAGAVADSGNELVAIGVLTGAYVFAADLLRALSRRNLDPEVDFITMSSYGDQFESSGIPKIVHSTRVDVSGKCVLLIEDIVDTGHTLATLVHHFKQEGAAKIITCVLLDKPARRSLDISPDFAGFVIEDQFIVGYGLDAAGRYRTLPFLAVVDAS